MSPTPPPAPGSARERGSTCTAWRSGLSSSSGSTSYRGRYLPSPPRSLGRFPPVDDQPLVPHSHLFPVRLPVAAAEPAVLDDGLGEPADAVVINEEGGRVGAERAQEVAL